MAVTMMKKKSSTLSQALKSSLSSMLVFQSTFIFPQSMVYTREENILTNTEPEKQYNKLASVSGTTEVSRSAQV